MREHTRVDLVVDGRKTGLHGHVVQHPLNKRWRGQTDGLKWTGSWHRTQQEAYIELTRYLRDLKERRDGHSTQGSSGDSGNADGAERC